MCLIELVVFSVICGAFLCGDGPCGPKEAMDGMGQSETIIIVIVVAWFVWIGILWEICCEEDTQSWELVRIQKHRIPHLEDGIFSKIPFSSPKEEI